MARREGLPRSLAALQQVDNEDIFVLLKLGESCPTHTRVSAPSLVPGRCPPRETTQGEYLRKKTTPPKKTAESGHLDL